MKGIVMSNGRLRIYDGREVTSQRLMQPWSQFISYQMFIRNSFERDYIRSCIYQSTIQPRDN
ncbi:MAG TPA: hypothetical protein VLJ21_03815 [Candidatus Binatia bacterium]|nr:hypothetical protein [Candidatus Binatia bacterium]